MNDGGPAFPFTELTDGSTDLVATGMKLRDWFAGQAIGTAMKFWMTNTDTGKFDTGYCIETDAELIAHDAYRLADAMLAEREKSK